MGEQRRENVGWGEAGEIKSQVTKSICKPELRTFIIKFIVQSLFTKKI